MTIAHIGPALRHAGGPGGYLAQLAAALANHGSGRHTVLFPESATPRAAVGEARSAVLLRTARRVKRALVGAPRYDRPSAADVARVDGEMGRMLERAWRSVQEEVAPSLAQAVERNADVIFAHDAPSACAALERRRRGQRIWLLLHTPMPLALYLAWCWGVPETAWEEVATFPDVQRWMAGEQRAIESVDRLFIPCADAAGELVRGDARFGPALARAELLLTGASSPASESARAGRQQWDLPGDRPVGLFLGNAQPYRGLDALLAGVELLPARSGPAGVVAIAGCPVEQLPIRSRLRALGHVDDVGGLLASADFVINVNRFSLFDLSTIEAAEAGRPLLLHATGGNRTFAALGAGTVMLPALDPATIAQGLTGMFAMPNETRARLGAASRTCYEGHLTPRHLRDRHIALYDAACGPGRGSR